MRERMTSAVGGHKPIHALPIPQQPTEPSVAQRPDGRLVLNGTGGDDTFNVRNLDNGYYGVNVGYGQGQTRDFTFNKDQMSRLTINARGGADTIAVAPNVDVPIRVNGGHGNDSILNGANGTNIYGGQGDDFIYNAGSNVQIHGGRGNDLIASAGSANQISGGRGNDQISSIGNGNWLRGGFGSDQIKSIGTDNSLRG